MRCEVSVALGDPLGMEGVCGPPSLSNCAGPLVMGWPGSGGNYCTIMAGCPRPGELHSGQRCFVVGNRDRICPPQGNRSTFVDYFPASISWHPASRQGTGNDT